jgi:photosystem II stability/assembly factor-like uncharacterized protein
MANDFVNDPNCHLLLNLEPGDLVTDSRLANDFVNSGVASDETNFKQGTGSGLWVSSETDYMDALDSSLSANFPLKSSDTIKVICILGWIRMTILPTGTDSGDFVTKWNPTDKTIITRLRASGGNVTAQMLLGYNGGATTETLTSHGSNLAVDTFYFVAFAYDNSDKSYVIAVRDAAGDLLGTDITGTATLDGNKLSVSTQPFRIGAHNPVPTSRFDGQMDEVVILDRIPTADEITLMAKGTYPTIPFVIQDRWPKKKTITITGGGSDVTDYLHKVTVTYDADMNTEFRDIRFSDAATGRTLPQKRLSFTPNTTAVFLVNLLGVTSASAATRDIVMYYGNVFSGVQLPWDNDDPNLAPVAQGFSPRYFPRNITNDSGQTGTKIAYHKGKIIISVKESNIAYFLASEDGGRTFEDISNSSALRSVGAIAPTPGDLRLLALGWNESSTRTFSYSTDGGVIWSTEVVIASGRHKEADLVALSDTEYFVVSEKSDKDDIKIYRTIDSGTNWSEYSTVASGILLDATNGAEDVSLFLLSNGNFICIWEEEETEKALSQIYMKISDDECATWGSKIAVWTQSVTTYDYEPAGLFEDRDGNLVSMIYTNLDDGGADTNYEKYLTRYKTSTDGGATWDDASTGTILHNLHAIGPENRIIKVGHDIYGVGYKIWETGGPFIYRFQDNITLGEMISGQVQTETGTIYLKDEDEAIVSGPNTGTETRGFIVSVASMPDDQRILARMKSNTVHGRLVFRYTDVDNHYLLTITDTGSNVFKRVSGTYTSLSTDATGYTFDGTYHEVEITMIGTAIKVWIDGNLEHDFTDAVYASGKVGMSLEGVTTSYFDYFIAGEVISSEPSNSFGAEADHSILLTPEQMSPQLNNINTVGGLSYGG